MVVIAVMVKAIIVVVAAHHVRYGDVVAAAKAVTVGSAVVAGNRRMTVLVTVVYVRPAAVVEVLACAFNAVMKAPALHVLQILRWRIPPAAKLNRNAGLGKWGSLEGSESGSAQKKGKSGEDESIQCHDGSPFLSRLPAKPEERQGNDHRSRPPRAGHCCSDADIWAAVA
jgi:hypothetical protein